MDEEDRLRLHCFHISAASGLWLLGRGVFVCLSARYCETPNVLCLIENSNISKELSERIL